MVNTHPMAIPAKTSPVGPLQAAGLRTQDELRDLYRARIASRELDKRIFRTLSRLEDLDDHLDPLDVKRLEIALQGQLRLLDKVVGNDRGQSAAAGGGDEALEVVVKLMRPDDG